MKPVYFLTNRQIKITNHKSQDFNLESKIHENCNHNPKDIDKHNKTNEYKKKYLKEKNQMEYFAKSSKYISEKKIDEHEKLKTHLRKGKNQK